MVEVEAIILAALEEAGPDGMTVGGLKRRTAGNQAFGMLIEVGVSELLEAGKVSLVKRPPKGGKRGRPLRVLIRGNGGEKAD